MSAPVELDGEPPADAEEGEDEGAARVLAAKPERREAVRAEALPESGLGGG
jgi:hypothetical protein